MVLLYKFGKANRDVRDFEAIKQRYNERLEGSKGKTYKGSQNMKIPQLSDKDYILNRLQTESKKLQYKTKKMRDKHLDKLILPHPLMGKMPIREIIMWTAYHVEHHNETLKKNYQVHFVKSNLNQFFTYYFTRKSYLIVIKSIIYENY